ncbi:MAG: type IV pilus modification protein PilV [Gammaproteobacteria bacterium]|nr:type IV pilus modification protein PilV [Gammaproteobacteria bacterium]
MSHIDNKTTHKMIQGMTLVEVMIALVILSVGLLGLAGLQIHGLRGSSNSNSRVQAVFIASDMAERMRANSLEFNTNLAYKNITLNASACGVQPTNCNTANCSTTQLFSFDNFQICQSMADNLPFGATMTVTCDLGAACVPNTSHTLTLSWNDLQDANIDISKNPNLKTITLQIQP